MATKFVVTHGGNVGILRVRIEDLKEVEKDGKKLGKKWVSSPTVSTIDPHSFADVYVQAGHRRVVIEEQPT